MSNLTVLRALAAAAPGHPNFDRKVKMSDTLAELLALGLSAQIPAVFHVVPSYRAGQKIHAIVAAPPSKTLLTPIVYVSHTWEIEYSRHLSPAIREAVTAFATAVGICAHEAKEPTP